MTAEGPSLDIDQLLAALERHQVDFLLVGGVAAIAYGACRPTAVPLHMIESRLAGRPPS